MKKQLFNNIRLGLFILAGSISLVLGLYYIGSNKNIFSSSIKVKADFNFVGGLMPGNNVRFNGINVGTVTDVYPISDTAIRVEFTIDDESVPFISGDAVASISTDGLLGSKLVNIAPGIRRNQPLREGMRLHVRNPVQMDNTIRTLLVTNDNLKLISERLKNVTGNFSNDNSLIRLLNDTMLANNVKVAVVKFKLVSNNAAIITGNLGRLAGDVRAGKGTVGAILTDTAISFGIEQTIVNIRSITDSLAYITGNFQSVADKINNGQGVLGTLLTDTTLVHNLNQSMENLKNGSGNFNDNMQALKHTWLLRKYFRKRKNESQSH